MTAGVYFIRAENGLVKVGRSSNVENRLRGLLTGSPIILTLTHVIETDRHKEVEYALHQRFAAQRRRGEWFELSEDDIVAAQAIAMTEAPASPPPPPAPAPVTTEARIGAPTRRGRSRETGAAAWDLLHRSMESWTDCQSRDDAEGASQWFEITQGILQTINEGD